MARRSLRTQDPDTGDVLLIEEDRYEVLERCPCGKEALHVRWFLLGEGNVQNARFQQEAVLVKEWDDRGELWWWFGRRIALSDLCASRLRLPQALKLGLQNPPSRLFYEGRFYRLENAADPVPEAGGDPASLTVWEYVDSEETESVLLEMSSDGEAVAYHGAYYDPELIKTL